MPPEYPEGVKKMFWITRILFGDDIRLSKLKLENINPVIHFLKRKLNDLQMLSVSSLVVHRVLDD